MLPICVKCNVQIKPKTNGVYVIEMAYEPPAPYKVWHADLVECPKCKVQVIQGFGNRALAVRGDEHFEKTLKTARKGIDEGTTILWFEK